MPKIGDKTGVTILCENCGKEVYKTLSQFKKRKHHFCSNKCQAEKKRKLVFEHRKCEICGSDLYVSKKSKQRFCSTECQRQWQTTRVGKLNPKFEGVEAKCDYCGKSYTVSNSNYNKCKNHFCSVECRQKWYAEIWSQNESWKEESRKRAARMLSQNPATNTRPQQIVDSILSRLNIDYINEEPFEYYSVDNYLPGCRLIIEVMGDYWHCNRIKYPEICYKVQANSIRRDKAKNTYIQRYTGINVLYLWESEVMSDQCLVESLILLYIRSKGVLDNYHSVNYEMDSVGNVVLKNDIIQMYQDMSVEEIRQFIRIAS